MPLSATTYSSVQIAGDLPAYVDEIGSLGYSVIAMVPTSREVCELCLTQGGHTICYDPSGPPPPLFCHIESEIVSVLVIYEDELHKVQK